VRVRQEIGVRAFDAWFGALDGSVQADELIIQCPDRFVRDWIRGRYGDAIERAAPDVRAVDYRVEGAQAAAVSAAPATQAPSAQTRETGQASFASFVPGPANALALEAARAVARGDAGRCNPLVLSGPSGVGKTHLCAAIQREVDADSVVYRSSEEFTSEVTQGIRSDRMAAVRHRYRRSANVLILEDVHFLRGKRATQVELFHTIDHLLSRGRSVVITANQSPAELDELDPALRSRLTSGLVAHIGPPELATRHEILRAKAAAGGVHLPDRCVEQLALRPIGSVRELLAGLNQVVARATLLKRAITEELVDEALSAVDVPGRRRSLEEIVDLVARAYSLDSETLRSRSRRRRITRPRQLAMYLCRRYTDASLADIGRALKRDHTSVLYAIDVVERRTLEQPQLRYELEALAARLGPPPR
jgi:chromosomal replication initiator protein